jgi:hypothetical protein
MVVHRFGHLALIAAAGMLGLAPASILAQDRVMITSTMGLGDSGASAGMVSKAGVERYAQLLGFSAEQKDLAVTLQEGYATEYQQARKTMRDAMAELRRSSEDTGDNTGFMEKMPAIQSEFRDKTTKLEKTLFSDFRALLSGQAQENKWPGVERMRRREVDLRAGGLSGESLDLVDIVGALKLPPDIVAALSPTMEAYEIDLDRQLDAREKQAGDMPRFEPGKPLDMEKMQKAMADRRDAGAKVVEINERHARTIRNLLPDDKRPVFDEQVKRGSFPVVYRPSRVARDLEAALKFADLTTEQKEQLTGVREQYDREAASLNSAWADAIKESEKDGQEGTLRSGAGAMMIRMGNEPEALKASRKARREADDRAAEKVKGLLTAAQREKLPKPAPDGPEGQTAGTMRFMVDDR